MLCGALHDQASANLQTMPRALSFSFTYTSKSWSNVGENRYSLHLTAGPAHGEFYQPLGERDLGDGHVTHAVAKATYGATHARGSPSITFAPPHHAPAPMTATPPGDPWLKFKDTLKDGFALGAPASSKKLREFGRALQAGLDGGAGFEKCRAFVREANDRIIAKSIGVLQFNAVLLAVIVLLIGEFGSGNYAVLACGVLVLASSLFLLFNMHLYTNRDASVYADVALHYRQQLVLFQRRARWHTFGQTLSIASLAFILATPFSPKAPENLPAAEVERVQIVDKPHQTSADGAEIEAQSAREAGPIPDADESQESTAQTTPAANAVEDEGVTGGTP